MSDTIRGHLDELAGSLDVLYGAVEDLESKTAPLQTPSSEKDVAADLAPSFDPLLQAPFLLDFQVQLDRLAGVTARLKSINSSLAL